MAPPLIQLSDIALGFGGAALLDGVELAVSAGERVCLVGRNGSGKSTLLRIAAGLIEPDRGARFVQPGASIRYLPQEPDLSGHASTLAYVEAGLGPTDDPHQARALLRQLGLSGEEDPAHLSGGEIRRAALARVLAPAPDILLLDEPTNHLDLPTIEWLERELAGQRAALVLISHDRRFLENLSRSTVWLDRGRARRVEIGFAAFEAWRDERLAEEEVAQHKLDRKIVAEEHWRRYGVSGRRKRNVLRAPAAALQLIGIPAASIDQLVVTHLHYDHAGTLGAFPKAHFHLQAAEMAYATGPCMCHPYLRTPFTADHVCEMVRHVYSGRVVFHEGDAEIAPGITVHKIGGHSRGLQCVRVATAGGPVVLASDASHYYENFEMGKVFPIVVDVEDTLRGYARLKALAASPRHIVPGHDPLVLQRYPALNSQTAGIVHRLDLARLE